MLVVVAAIGLEKHRHSAQAREEVLIQKLVRETALGLTVKPLSRRLPGAMKSVPIPLSSSHR